MSQPGLPTELIMIILSIAATHHRPTAAHLSLVSKWVRNMVEPILYRVLVLKHARVADAYASLYLTKFNTFARCLGIVHGQVLGIRAHEKRPLSIRNFATDSGSYDDIIVRSDVEELHLLTWRSPGWEFPRLQRLHCCWQKYVGGIHFPIHEILKHQRLTHIAFSLSEELRMPSLISAVVRLLNEHKPLLLLYVRLLPSSIPTVGQAIEAIDYESLDDQLASIMDARLVVRRVRLEASRHSFLGEWEDNALHGETIWN